MRAERPRSSSPGFRGPPTRQNPLPHRAPRIESATRCRRGYAAADLVHLDEFLARADRLTRDPLQRLLLFLGLREESADSFAGDDPGCLYASYAYERELFGAEIRDVLAESVRAWRTALGDRIGEVAALHPPRLPVDLNSLADTFLSAFEGSYVLSRALGEPDILRAQLGHVRSYFELLFEPAQG
jgi:TetR/AcrR family transcriptional repressor of nem operon